mgnify:CR=1 FL=1|tara:strand:- start:79 stop:294 length:216 start_codon:yes stop_codon:yes gene_type:complete
MDTSRFRAALEELLTQPGGISLKAWDHLCLGATGEGPLSRVIAEFRPVVRIDWHVDERGYESKDRRVWLDK